MERMKAILTLTAALAFALSPLTTAGFNGFRPDQFPVPQVDPPVQPAGYAFGIWGVIYLWLLAGAVYGLLKRAEAPGWDAMRWPLIASLVFGAAWIPVAQLSPVQATVMIWAMLGTALWALMACGRADRAWLRTPVALYAGWLTAASCVALGLVLAGHGVMTGQSAAIVMIGVALVIGACVVAARPDAPEYALALAWALVGVIVDNLDPLNMPVLALCIAGVALLGALVARAWRRSGA
ncbi:hypothetical protein [Roseovarius salis]|uniref:hypothetical protein n=1 Tax=Roseovarius salis TaxID=3376063 RepID=UPI0037C856B7